MTDEIKVTFTYCNTAYEAGGTLVEEVSWDDFAKQWLQEHFHFPEPLEGESADSEATKLRSPQFIPGSFKNMGPKATKSLENLDSVYLGVLDFDDVPDEELERIRNFVEKNDYAAIIYSTFKHAKSRKKQLNRFRLMVPLDRPVPKEEWPGAWTAIVAHFGAQVDASCSDAGRGYQVPSAPQGTDEEDLILEAWPAGEALKVDQIYAGIDEQEGTPEIKGAGKAIKERTLLKFAKKLQRRNSDTGECIERMLGGEPFAESGNRDNIIFQMCQDIGKEFPNSDAKQIAEWFGPSLSNMPGEEEITLESVQKKIERAQGSALSGIYEKSRATAASWRSVKKMTGTDQYTKEGMLEYLEETQGGTSLAGMRDRLIIFYGRAYYLFFDYTYKPYERESVFKAFKEIVETPASSLWSVRSHKVDKNGNDVPMTAQELLNEYGTGATDAVIKLGENTSYFDEGSRELVLGQSPVRAGLRPIYSSAVDKWMQKACRTQQALENLRDWMALVPNLDNRLAMLVLMGEKGIGKTPFIKGLARLWSNNYVDMSVLFESFPEDIIKCPMLLADEEFPKDWKGHTPSAKIRSTLSNKEHLVNRKGLARIRVSGFLRLAVAVNNYEKMNALGQKNRSEDTEALLSRMLIIDCNSRAVKYFNGDLFVEGNALAQHALWLQEQREEDILKSGDAAYGIRNLQVPLGSLTHLIDPKSEEVLEWICMFLEDRTGEEEQHPPAIVAKGRVFVASRRVYDSWAVFFGPKAKGPTYFEIRRIVQDISDGSVRVKIPVGKQVTYHAIQTKILLAYVRNTGMVGDIDQQLDIFSEKVAVEENGFRLPHEMYPVLEDWESREAAVEERERQKNAAE